MGCSGGNQSIQVFTLHFLSNVNGKVNEVMSAPIPMTGNKVVALPSIISMTSDATGILEVEIQAGYGDDSWTILGSSTSSTIGPFDTPASASAVAQAYVRFVVRTASNAGANTRVIFNLVAAFSHQ